MFVLPAPHRTALCVYVYRRIYEQLSSDTSNVWGQLPLAASVWTRMAMIFGLSAFSLIDVCVLTTELEHSFKIGYLTEFEQT